MQLERTDRGTPHACELRHCSAEPRTTKEWKGGEVGRLHRRPRALRGGCLAAESETKRVCRNRSAQNCRTVLSAVGDPYGEPSPQMRTSSPR